MARIIIALLAPAFVFFVGVAVTKFAAGKISIEPSSEHARELNKRLWGYAVEDVQNHWALLTSEGAMDGEQRFLTYDLVFAFVFCGSLAAGQFLIWSAPGRSLDVAWLLAPLAIVLVMLGADWTENLVQLSQLERFNSSAKTLDGGWIRAASIATTTKLVAAGLSCAGIAGLAVLRFLKMQ